jgi:hypothetical protein
LFRLRVCEQKNQQATFLSRKFQTKKHKNPPLRAIFDLFFMFIKIESTLINPLSNLKIKYQQTTRKRYLLTPGKKLEIFYLTDPTDNHSFQTKKNP